MSKINSSSSNALVSQNRTSSQFSTQQPILNECTITNVPVSRPKKTSIPHNSNLLGIEYSTPKAALSQGDNGLPKVVIQQRVDIVRQGSEDIKAINRPPQIIEKLVKVPHEHHCFYIVEVPNTEQRILEKIIEVPEIIKKQVYVTTDGPIYKKIQQYKEEKITHLHEHTIFKEIEIPHFIDKPIQHIQEISIEKPLDINTPKLVEAIQHYEITLPRVVPKYEDIEIPIYIPRCIRPNFCKFDYLPSNINLIENKSEYTSNEFHSHVSTSLSVLEQAINKN